MHVGNGVLQQNNQFLALITVVQNMGNKVDAFTTFECIYEYMYNYDH
jgi:hypothetical protein